MPFDAPGDFRSFRRVLPCVLAAVWTPALLLCIGCGGGDDLAPVDGMVRLNGEPLTRGIVTFTPEAGRSASGTINSDGTFRLGTYDERDGALVGTHGVSITATEASSGRPNFDSDRVTPPKDLSVPPRYASAETSGLTFEVKAGESNHAEFDLQ